MYFGPSVVVGVDGSKAAVRAAVWAIDEAVSRDIPLRLVSVIDPRDLCGADADRIHFGAARTALHEARCAVEATGAQVKIETDVVTGNPAAKLAEESRCASLVCVGAIGVKHACHGLGSVAAALVELACCPVAVIDQAAHRPRTPDTAAIVVEADNGVVLRHAFEEARLRSAPLRIVACRRAGSPEDDTSRLLHAHLNRRIAPWVRLYPEVPVQTVAVSGSVCRYLAAHAESVQLFVTGPRGHRCDIGRPDLVDCSLLAVPGSRL
ncbi:universal stress protein [Mycobacterium sp. pUA109]